MLYQFCLWFLFFITYSILGYIFEVIGCSIVKKRLVLSRGFLLGPYCPLFGLGSVSMIWLLKGYLNNPLILFMMAILLCTIIEYITSYIMEKLFKTRWWNYLDHRFNINGRVCLQVSFLFGLLGLVLLYGIHPFYSHLLEMLSPTLIIDSSLILFLLFVCDCLLSFIFISKLKFSQDALNQDSTDYIKKKQRTFLVSFLK